MENWLTKKDFEKNGYTSENGKLVHSIERIFSILTKAQGYDVFVNKNIKKYSQKYKPKFSIILPTYNRASFIKDAIDSLLLQSYENYELIIVDDGSTDNSEKLIKTSYFIISYYKIFLITCFLSSKYLLRSNQCPICVHIHHKRLDIDKRHYHTFGI